MGKASSSFASLPSFWPLRHPACLAALACAFLSLPTARSLAQTNRPPVRVPDWVALEPNIPYEPYQDTVLDVMWPKAKTEGKRPGVVMFHGGGWIRSTKETMMGSFCIPYLRQGFVVCNVEYRVAPVAKAPAAVEDALHAAKWFFDHADQYNVDTNRIVVTGASAGGHLALMVGMVTPAANLGPTVKMAAIVNCYGIADVADLLQGPHRKSWATEWLPEQPGRMELAKRLSPLTYARKELPPILTVQGAEDTTVPVAQGKELTKALQAAGVDAKMIIQPNARHGFSKEQWPALHKQIFAFLRQHGILTNSDPKVHYTPPQSPRAVYNFNIDWKFFKGDVAGAEQPGFDDSKWTTVSTPHTWNDVDTYDELISHSGGERHEYMGIGWYRKHFKLPAAAKGDKVFLEFEGLKQAGRFWVNGKFAGKYENGVTPCGLDLTGLVNFGDADNVIAVKVDNSNDYKEEATGVPFEWMGRAFNPNYGGLNHDIWLHLTGKVYQTLPLYENLKTTGIYIYPEDFSLAGKSCDVTVQSQVRNESADPQSITLSAVVVDEDGQVRAKFESAPSDLVSGQTETFTAAGRLTGTRFWDVDDPYLYDVYTMLTVDGKVVDVCKTRTGFRKTEFRGGAGTGGVYLNGRFVYLTGYAQRSSDDWAGLGQAYPDWMHDYNAELIRSTHANYIRWMHIAPQRVDVSACDQAGIIEICPAGDKERDVQGRQWEQRVEVMRDTMIFYRNHPSILFWEGGNTVITPEHMRQMVELRKQWDPNGGRVAGTRGNSDNAANTAITPIAEYYGVMIGQDPRTDALKGPTAIFRGYSAERRDRAPLIETEDFRDEAARRFWDNYSPPHFGFKPGPKDVYHWNSETFCLAAAVRYHDYYINRISNPDPAHSKWSGYASIYWSDSNADGRQDSSEVCRVSGKVDSVRLPKQAFYVYRVMQNPEPDIHIIGHWTYPTNTVKTVYVAANHCDAVELFVNGESLGTATKPCDFVDKVTDKDLGNTGYIYAFDRVKFEPGTIRALAILDGKPVAQDEIETAGPPARLKLTAHTGPNGLRADGADVAFIDVETVDADGRRCPTDEARVDFEVSGPAIWRGGYNSGITNSVNHLYLNTECGINRVAIRSTLTPGKITVKATRPGLEPGSVTIESAPVGVKGGLASDVPPGVSLN